MITNQYIYFNMYGRLYIALFNQSVTQSKGPLNLCCSVNSF
jgi:hypothetical protein